MKTAQLKAPSMEQAMLRRMSCGCVALACFLDRAYRQGTLPVAFAAAMQMGRRQVSVNGRLPLWRTLVATLAVTLSLVGIMTTGAGAADVLILGPTIPQGVNSYEYKIITGSTSIVIPGVGITGLGLTADIVTAGAWATPPQPYSAYKAIVLGDPNCGGSASVAAAVANASTWAPAAPGNVVIIGTDPSVHPGVGGVRGAQLWKSAIGFAVAGFAGSGTGAVISLSCYYGSASAGTAVPVLSGFGTFTVQGSIPCVGNVAIVASSPALTGLTGGPGGTLSAWSCSVHEGFNSWAPTFIPLAVAIDVAPGLKTYPVAAPIGFPYILARGKDLTVVDNGGGTGTECFKDVKSQVTCNPNGTYTLTLTGAGFPGTSITLTSQTPGVTVTPPQQPWSAATTWTLVGATPGQTVTLSANATQAGGGSVPGTDLCCSGEIKIVMPDCPKPIDVKIGKEDTAAGGSGTWFNLWVTNVGASITFPPGGITVTDVIPAGMTVTGLAGTGPNWTCLPLIPPPLVGLNTLTCKYNLAGTLAAGAQLLESILIHYTTTGPGPFRNCATVTIGASVGVDTNPSNDKACVDVTGTPVDVGIVKTGGTTPVCHIGAYAWHLTVTNWGAGWPGTGNIVVKDTVPANMTFGPPPVGGPGWSCVPPGGPAGTVITCTYTGPGPTAGQVLPVINILATATIPPPFPPYTNTASVSIPSSSGYLDTVASNNSSTVTVSKPAPCPQPPPIDLAIDKEEDFSGSLGRPVINIYIINVGPPITFGPGQLTVTESIPVGYTVTNVNAPNWTCSPTSLVGAGTVTCTYNLAGSLATGWGLPANDSITIDGMLTGPGPLQNCATVTVGASVGVETNLANNTVCRPIGVPVRTCDPATTITRGAECPCRYPNMVRTSKRACMCLSGASFVAGRGCIPRLACPPPLVPGPIPGVCACPTGTTLVGQECVRRPVCTPPMVPGPAGQCIDVRPTCTPPKVMRDGQCVDVRPTCDPPKAMRRGKCVEVRPTCERPKEMRRGKCVELPRPVCNPPAKLNRRKICECPTNMVAIGKTCRERRPAITITPRDFIRDIPGRGRETPRTPRGGSQGPADSPGRR